MNREIFDFLQYLRQEKNVSHHTERSYLADLEQFFEFLGERSLPEVDHQLLRLFLAHLLAAGMSKTSMARKLSTLRTFFKYLNRTAIVPANPARLVATPRREKRLPAVITMDERNAAHGSARLLKEPRTCFRDRAVLETLYSTGIRASELTGMNREDIDRQRPAGPHTGQRPQGKGRPHRTKGSGSDRQLSGRSRKSAPSDPVFTGPGGNRLTARTVQRILEKYRKKTGSSAEGKPAYPSA